MSLCLDEAFESLPPTGESIGVDLGINRLATLSDGGRIANPKHSAKWQKKLAKAQREFSRKTKGSKRREKARLKVARIHARIADARLDHLHKITTDLVRRFDVIAIEDLNVRGMVRNHCLARSISDASFGSFRSLLDYKCKRYGKQLVAIDRFFPSSKTCSHCGAVQSHMALVVRSWQCACGATHDRDENAAKNILNFAMGHIAAQVNDLRYARGELVRHGAVSVAPCAVR